MHVSGILHSGGGQYLAPKQFSSVMLQLQKLKLHRSSFSSPSWHAFVDVLVLLIFVFQG